MRLTPLRESLSLRGVFASPLGKLNALLPYLWHDSGSWVCLIRSVPSSCCYLLVRMYTSIDGLMIECLLSPSIASCYKLVAIYPLQFFFYCWVSKNIEVKAILAKEARFKLRWPLKLMLWRQWTACNFCFRCLSQNGVGQWSEPKWSEYPSLVHKRESSDKYTTRCSCFDSSWSVSAMKNRKSYGSLQLGPKTSLAYDYGQRN